MGNVFVVGTGTIGEPLIGLLADHKSQLGIEEIFFTKLNPLRSGKPKINDLVERGAKFVCYEESTKEFEKIGIHPVATFLEALAESAIAIECTKKGVGLKNREKYYSLPKYSGKYFVSQGSEYGFGTMYARNISDRILIGKKGHEVDQFWTVVSCNTHNAAVIIDTIGMNQGKIGPDNILDCQLVYIRRANDVGQIGGFIPSIEVGRHTDAEAGGHQARDARKLFKTLGYDLSIWASIAKAPTQYMHAMHFCLTLAEKITLDEVFSRVENNRLIAITKSEEKKDKQSCEVFSFGRDHGYFGRILNQTVLVENTVTIRKSPFGYQVIGWCFTPQDGNSLLSTASLVDWLLNPESYPEKASIFLKRPYTFREV